MQIALFAKATNPAQSSRKSVNAGRWNSFRSGDSAGCHAGSRCPSHLGNKHVMKSPTDLDNSKKEKPRKPCESNNFAFQEMDSAFGKE
ncbi:hypothetical protein DdX_12160 [Ditylenchus destructor]|uniref:Uncharacterized protein n=1 Tax=Ditylenchus destructor TaxID=166010 RepID=A0AAD4MY81_9BILA|nr:hypothetical protein DdX_12160 [Ditylenchus destructor]